MGTLGAKSEDQDEMQININHYYPLKRHLYFAADDNLKFCRFYKINE